MADESDKKQPAKAEAPAPTPAQPAAPESDKKQPAKAANVVTAAQVKKKFEKLSDEQTKIVASVISGSRVKLDQITSVQSISDRYVDVMLTSKTGVRFKREVVA